MDEYGELPPRLIDADEEIKGDRVNVYQKIEIIRVLRESLGEEEYEFLRSSQLGRLFDLPSKPAWSGAFGLFLLYRQLLTNKENEMWVLFSGSPVRFSLREFKIVTGLHCGKYPAKEKKKMKISAGKKVTYFETLFGHNGDVTVERVLYMLQKKQLTDREQRLRLASLALIDGILVPTTHYPRCKILPEHVAMVEDLDAFLRFPWGRLSFERIMNSLKERDLARNGTANVAIQGLFQALQMVILEAVPAIEEGPDGADVPGSDDFEGVIPTKRQKYPFNLKYAKELDEECEVDVAPIIRPEMQFLDELEDLTWTDDEEDPRVDNMMRLIEEEFCFQSDMFVGGSKPSEILRLANKKKGVRAKLQRPKKTTKVGRQLPPSRRSATSASNVEAELSPRVAFGADAPPWVYVLEKNLSAIIETKFQDHKRDQESHLGQLISSKLAENNDSVIGGIIKWFTENLDVGKGECVTDTDATTQSDVQRNVSNNEEAINFANIGKGENTVEMTVSQVAEFYASQQVNDESNSKRARESPVEDVPNDPLTAQENLLAKGTNEDMETDVVGPEEQGGGEASVDEVSDDEESVDGTDEEVNDGEENVEADTETLVNKDGEKNVLNATETLSDKDVEGNVGNGNGTLVSKVMDGNVVNEAGLLGSKSKEVEAEIMKNTEALNKEDNNFTDKEAAAVVARVPDEAVGVRKGRRTRTVSVRCEDLPQSFKKIKKDSDSTKNTDTSKVDYCQNQINTLTKPVKLGPSMSLSAKELTDLILRKKHVPSKVMDAFMKFSRHILRSIDKDGVPLRVDVLDSKFVSLLCRQYPKFCKAADRKKFVFPKSLVDLVEGCGEEDRVPLLTEADLLYLPFNFDKSHWVALVVSMKEGTLHVLDSNISLRTHFAVLRDIEPIAVMLPYLLRQTAEAHTVEVDTEQLYIERVAGIPQTTAERDSALMTIFFIQAHGFGGIEACEEVDVESLDSESRKLVQSLLVTYSS